MNKLLIGWRIWEERMTGFWFFHPCLSTLALLRVVTGVVWFFSFFTLSFDLKAHMGADGWAPAPLVASFDQVAWPFNVFALSPSPVWLWTAHLLALLTATIFVLGLWPSLSGLALLLFHLSYMHRNPAVVTELDKLLLMALILLAMAPSGRHLALPPIWRLGRFRYSYELENPGNEHEWGSFVLRLIQLQLLALYWVSALGRMSPQWLSGAVMLHPRLFERGLPIFGDTLAQYPALAVLMSYGLLLFQLFYPVFIWFKGARSPLVVAAIGLHLLVGLAWGNLAFNLMMAALHLSFLEAGWIEQRKDDIKQMLGLPWVEEQTSKE